VALNAYARTTTDRLVLPVGKLLVRLGATANWLTFSGLVGTVVGMGVVLAGAPVPGAIVAALASCVDALDGTVARLRGSVSPFGSFYDSVVDRVSDSVILGTAAWLVRDSPVLFALAVVAFAGALITSYIRAKAESLGWDATVGVIERPERLVISITLIGLGQAPAAVVVLAVGAVVTIAQRFGAVLRQVDRT